MPWFTQESLDFLRDLKENNNREWFHENKKRYDKHIKAKMEEFSAEMIGQMQKLDPTITMQPKQALSRINRDTRFSKGKEPYKTNSYLVISSGGKKSFATPGLFFSLSADEISIASGLYMLETAQLAAARRHIMANGPEFRKLIADEDFKKFFTEIQGQENKILPPEFKEAAQSEPTLFKKQFFYWQASPSSQALADDLPEFVMERMRACWPLNEFWQRALS